MAEYDVGSGRTYSTPQDAFDALQAANETGGVPQDFTSDNYIRFYGDAVYTASGAGDPVLRLVHSISGRGVQPTVEHRLIIDVDGTDSVSLRDIQSAAAIINGDASGQNLASHITIDGVDISSSAGGSGIILCEDSTGGETCTDWRIGDVDINVDQYGLVCGCIKGKLRMKNVRILGRPALGGIVADGSGGTYGSFHGVLSLANVVINAAGPAISIAAEDSLFELFHVSGYSAGDHVIVVDDDSAADWLTLSMSNCALKTGDASDQVISSDFAGLELGHSDSNTYYGAASDLATIAGTGMTLGEWQTRFGQDANSAYEDPDFADELLRPDSNSPLLLSGDGVVAAGWEGAQRATAIDRGAYQVSNAGSWDVAKRGSKLVANIGGSIPIEGF